MIPNVKHKEPKYTTVQKYIQNYEKTNHTERTNSNVKSYHVINKHSQSPSISNKTLSGGKRQNNSSKIDHMRELGISPRGETSTGFQRSTTSDKSEEQCMTKESLLSHISDSVNEVKNELYTSLKIDDRLVNKTVRSSIETLFEKFKTELMNEWPDFIRQYLNKLSQTEEEVKRLEKKLEKESQKNDTMKSDLSSYKEEYEKLKKEKLTNERNMESTIKKYEEESTRTQSIYEKAKECKNTIKDLCNQIFYTQKALSIYCQQLGKIRIDEQCIKNLRDEEVKLIDLINIAKLKFDGGIRIPSKLELPPSDIPTHYEVKILEN